MSTLTPEAKQLLSTTIRSLRERLLQDIRDEADRRYRLSVPIGKAGLDEAHRKQRERLEDWLDQQTRAAKPKNKKEEAATRERLLRQAEKEAGATLLNRIVCLRHLEALGLSKPSVVTGGWNSKGYREYREFAPALTGDDTEGYATLLQLLFDELAVDLPGLFGDVGLTTLFAVPPATLRELVDGLDDPKLDSAWTDDTTLGWVYQYWNDPEREALDAKLNSGGKIEPHEIASKTQMFTERYMVEWLLHNSLGLTWLCICKKNGWPADVERVLPVLEERRAEWRKKREAGEVALDALMPIEGELEDHWKYYVPQPIPDDAVESAPASIRKVKILDPAAGSGHFLVIAFDLLAALHREEARHRGKEVTDREIAESILENNLHGIDIDPRAIQIAAAGLYLKAKTLSREAKPRQVNLVAPVLQLGSLPKDDPALVQLRRELKDGAGIPEDLTNHIVAALAGVDHLGSLLKVDAAVEEAIRKTELEFEQSQGQGDLFGGFPAQQVKLSVGEAKATVLDKLERFLAQNSRSEDLGLRLGGEQVAAGVRFARTAREGVYDLVVGNPPYQSTSRIAQAGYVTKHYPMAKADLYAAFVERSLQLVREGGLSALVAMRGWMFLGQFAELRRCLLHDHDLRVVADIGTGAFSSRSMDDVISSAMPIFRRGAADCQAVGVQAAPLSDPTRDAGKPARRQAALLCGEGRHTFDPSDFQVIPGEPVVYWWPRDLLERYARAEKLGDMAPARKGLCTGNDRRFVRLWWEVPRNALLLIPHHSECPSAATISEYSWHPAIYGGKGAEWFHPVKTAVSWQNGGLLMHLYSGVSRGVRIQNADFYFREGVAFSAIGAHFSARIHRHRSVFGDKGPSVFPPDPPLVCCVLNSEASRDVLQSLNPTISFQVGDVNRVPLFPVHDVVDVMRALEDAFTAHESARESSVEFKRPGPSPWRSAQDWAQLAVDRHEGVPLPPYDPEFDPPAPEAHISFALGVALGRFGADGTGILDEAPSAALPHGLLFLSAADGQDGLRHPACKKLRDAWADRPKDAAQGYDDLGDYLRRAFFKDVHKGLYENRPIYFPLSSAKRSFVAYGSIHRWQDDTLQVLLADYLVPERRRLDAELEDLRKARAEKGKKGKAEKRFAEVQKLLEELNEFIDAVTEVAEKGPPQPDPKTPPRETAARYVMDLDDGVMVNSSALWPLLEPQWKDPKKWWKELATAKGRKDYDWSHLAARYFPTRVDQKCHEDPSLAVAHKCFWRLWPAKAYAWELRLQDEIRPDFTIDEPGSDEGRAKFLAQRAKEAEEIEAAEMKRRERKAAKEGADDDPSDGPLFEQAEEEEVEDDG